MTTVAEGQRLPLYDELALPAKVMRRSRTLAHVRMTEAKLLIGGDLLVLTAIALLIEPLFSVAAFAGAALVWRARGLYAPRFALSVLDDLPNLLLGGVAALLADTALHGLDARPAVPHALAIVGAVFVARAVSYRVILTQRARGRINHRAVILGAGSTGLNVMRRIQDHPEVGLRTLGFLDDAPMTDDLPIPLLGDARDLARVVNRDRVSDVIVAYGRLSSADLVEVLRMCDRMPVRIHVVPRLFEMHQLAAANDQVWGIPLVTLRQQTFRGFAWRVKRALDVVLSGLALLALAPVLTTVAVAVRRELGPGVLFKQVRVGLDGRAFTVRKFRSMKSLPLGVDNPWTVASEDRIGPVGRFIRKYSIDELPQLFDVLVGNMSLVGPRPERPEYVEQFCEEVPRYWARHRVPVGLTGLAAVHGLRGDTSITDRAYFDNLYIENWSLWLDIKIMARTVLAVVRGTGG